MQRVAIFYNPHASSVSSSNLLKDVCDGLFRSHIETFPLVEPVKLKVIIKDLIQREFNDIVILGGDGSVNLIIQELANTNVALLVIPGGTANDLAKELRTSHGIEDAVYLLREKLSRSIDLVSVNGRYFATSGGIGVGANVTDRLNEIRKRIKGFNHLLRFFKHHIYSGILAGELMLPLLPVYELKLTFQDKVVNVKTPLMIVSNQPKIAGTINAGDHVKNDDGLFDLFIFTHPTRILLITALFLFVIGKAKKNDPYLLTFKTEMATIESKRKFKFFGDGEVFGTFTKVVLKISPKSLLVYNARGEGRS